MDFAHKRSLRTASFYRISTRFFSCHQTTNCIHIVLLVVDVKPGKGNFVVRVSGVETPIVELLGMKRPFPALKALDMDEISAQVLAAIES